jgi:hypothetical protein
VCDQESEGVDVMSITSGAKEQRKESLFWLMLMERVGVCRREGGTGRGGVDK